MYVIEKIIIVMALYGQVVNGNSSMDHWCWRSDPRLPFSDYSNCTADLWRKEHNFTYVSAPLLFPMDSNTNVSMSMSVLTNVVYMERNFSGKRKKHTMTNYWGNFFSCQAISRWHANYW